MPSDAEVLIVGAGPAGLLLAGELLRRGVPCRLIERKAQADTTSRAFTLHARTLEMFQQIGLASTALAQGRRTRGFYFHFRGSDEHPVLDFTGLPTRYPFVLVHSQSQTEQLLRDHLKNTYGHEPEWGVELTALNAADETLSVTLKSADGKLETCQPQWVVGCDGIHSAVRKAMSIPYIGEDYSGMLMQMMDTHCHHHHSADDWTHYFVDQDHFLLLSRLPSGHHRVLLSDMGQSERDDLSPQEAFLPYLRTHLPDGVLDPPLWATKWRIWKRLASRFKQGRVLLAGDAAHVHSPSGGQGMNLGLADAFNLGWKLAMTVNGLAKPALLDSYQQERRPIAKMVIDHTDAVHDIIMAHGADVDGRLDQTKQAGWHDQAVNRIAGLSHQYVLDETPSPPSSSLKSGQHMPDGELADGGYLYDRLHPEHLTVVFLPANSDQRAACERLHQAIEPSFGHLLKWLYLVEQSQTDVTGSTIQITPQQRHQWSSSGQSGPLFCVRPDGYIGFSGLCQDLEPLLAYLNHNFVRRD